MAIELKNITKVVGSDTHIHATSIKLGEGRFNAPTLVLARGHSAGEGLGVKTAGGRDYIDNARGIGLYFAGLYGTPVPRGSALA